VGIAVRGHHGTTRDIAKRVANGEIALLPSINGYDWLGSGAYFWQDAPDRARIWAQKRHGVSGEPLAVISATIDLTDCLDLCDAAAFRDLLSVYADFEAFEARVGVTKTQAGLVVLRGEVITTRDLESDPTKKSRPMLNRRDHAFLDYFVGLAQTRGAPIPSIRGPFIEGRALFPTSFLFDWAHVQISVIDARVLSDWRVDEIPDDPP